MGRFSEERGWRDAWEVVHPPGRGGAAEGGGVTFDPVRNPLAKLNSRTGQPARFDRVLLRSQVLQVARVEVFGQSEPVLSDHYGLLCTVHVDPSRAADEVDIDGPPPPPEEALEVPPAGVAVGEPLKVTTALVWIPPPASWQEINAIRERHDPKVDRWMCHVSILYPFISVTEFNAFAKAVGKSLRVGAFDFGSDADVAFFQHTKSHSEVIVPGKPAEAEFTKLHNSLSDLIPGGRSGGGGHPTYRPHLTVKRTPLAKSARGTPSFTGESLQRLTESWRVERLCLMSREGGSHFVVKRIVALPGAEPLNPEAIVRSLKCGLPHFAFQAVGSHLLCGATPESDVDVLCVGHVAPYEALPAIQRFLETCGLFYGVHEISNRHMTFLRAYSADGVEIDLHYVTWPHPDPPWEVPLEELRALMTSLPAQQAVALSMVSEPRWLLQFSKVNALTFGRCLKAVKTWARRARVYGQVFGFLGGLSWSIMTSLVLHSLDADATADVAADVTTDVFLARFCRTFASWDWGAVPVAAGSKVNGRSQAGGGGQRPVDFLMRFLLVTLPGVNSARTVTRSTRSMLVCALRGGPERGQRATSALKSALPLTLALTLRGEGQEDVHVAVSWFATRLPKLLVQLEKLGGVIAPDCKWEELPTAEDEVVVRWSVKYERDSTGVAGQAESLQLKFYADVKAVAMVYEVSSGG